MDGDRGGVNVFVLDPCLVLERPSRLCHLADVRST